MSDAPAKLPLELRLARLAAKPAALRLDALTADWQARVRAGRNPRHRALATQTLSQLLHGEELTARICAGLAPRLALPAATDCLRRQEHDEADHAIAYGRYLAALGGRAPPCRVLGWLEARIEGWRGAPEALILATQVLLEGEAMALQESSVEWLPCPRLTAMNRAIARDEARHVAFARLYLPAVLPALALRERQEIHAWLRETWYDGAERLFADLGFSVLFPAALGRRWAARRWDHWRGELCRIGLYQDHESQLFAA